MLTSTFISQLRRKYGDVPESSQVIRQGDGSTTLFNAGRNRVPIVEGSYTVYLGTSAKVDVTDYTLDKDSGDLQMIAAPAANLAVKMNFKHAFFRDQHWMEAIGAAIDALNGRGYYRQIVRSPSGLVTSAGVMTYDGPAGCIDLYDIIVPGYPPFTGPISSTPYVSGGYVKLQGNWAYQSDANKVILGFRPIIRMSAQISYLRTLNKYTTTSATLDVRNEWLSLLELYAGAYHFRHMASKIAKQGNATVKEGHFSFTSLRTQAVDLENSFEAMSKRMKPSRPAKDIHQLISPGNGIS